MVFVIVMEYLGGRYLYRKIDDGLRKKKLYGEFGVSLMEKSDLYHESTHFFGYALTFGIPFSIYKKDKPAFSLKTNINNESYGEFTTRCSAIQKLIISMMPLALIGLLYLGVFCLFHFNFTWQVVAAPIFIGFIVPALIGSFPSEIDVSSNSIFLITPIVCYFIYIWFIHTNIKPVITFLLCIHILLASAIAVKGIIFFFVSLMEDARKIKLSCFRIIIVFKKVYFFFLDVLAGD